MCKVPISGSKIPASPLVWGLGGAYSWLHRTVLLVQNSCALARRFAPRHAVLWQHLLHHPAPLWASPGQEPRTR